MDLRIDLTAFRAVAEGLAIGLLVGIERYRGREPGERRSAGVRTFAIIAVLGAVCGLFEHPAVAVSVFAAVALLVAAGYHRSNADSPGLTTEIAALLVFWLGVLLHAYEVLAISTAIVLTILLASKSSMHEFVREQISETEFFDTLKFLAVVLVIFPLLPDSRLGPFGFLNPRQAWLLVILVSGIGYSGYFLVKWLGHDRGLKLNALAGGIISTSAATLSLAGRARETPELSSACGRAAVIANSVQFPRILILLAVVDGGLARLLALPLLAAGASGALMAWWMAGRDQKGEPGDLPPPDNPFSLLPALKFAGFLIGILFLVEVARAALGATGIYLASAIGGLGSVSAVVLSMAEQLGRGALSVTETSWALLIAFTANACLKVAIATVHGTRGLALRLAAGLLLMLATGVLVAAISS